MTSSVQQRLLDFLDSEKQKALGELEEDKNKAIQQIEAEFTKKRKRIEEEYDAVNERVNPTLAVCNLKTDNCERVSWSCPSCNYNLCNYCIEKIHAVAKENTTKKIPVFKLDHSLKLTEHKEKYMKDQMKCPHCRSCPLKY